MSNVLKSIGVYLQLISLTQAHGGTTVDEVSTADIEWLNTAETARRLGVTPRTLYRFIDDGQLPAYRFGRVIRLKEAEVEEFIERCRIQPGTLDITTPAPQHDLSDV